MFFEVNDETAWHFGIQQDCKNVYLALSRHKILNGKNSVQSRVLVMFIFDINVAQDSESNKLDQSRPLFIYFRPFLITIAII